MAFGFTPDGPIVHMHCQFYFKCSNSYVFVDWKAFSKLYTVTLQKMHRRSLLSAKWVLGLVIVLTWFRILLHTFWHLSQSVKNSMSEKVLHALAVEIIYCWFPTAPQQQADTLLIEWVYCVLKVKVLYYRIDIDEPCNIFVTFKKILYNVLLLITRHHYASMWNLPLEQADWDAASNCPYAKPSPLQSFLPI